MARIIDISTISHFRIYETYLRELQVRGKSDAVLATSVKEKKSERMIYVIVRDMEDV